MPSTITIRSILDRKGAEVYWLPPDASVYQAVEMMATKGVGALVVLEDDKLIGILSERDYARKVILKGKASKETAVSAIMTSPVVYVTPDCPVDEALCLITEKRIRHLPVLERDRLAGIVSIGDMVKSINATQAATIEQLHAYITGQYPG